MFRNRVLLVVSLLLALTLSVSGESFEDGYLYHGPEGEGIPQLVSWRAPILEIDGLKFKDLNENGILDDYEDWRLLPKQRAADLLQKMDHTEKAAQMLHITLYSPQEQWFSEQNVGFALAYTYLEAGPREAAEAANRLQQLSESSRWGIPLIISMDSVVGASWVKGATLYPDQIGLGAAGDVELVKRLNEMQRREMAAMGVRMSLSPIADLATEPRWGRFQECFGADANLVSEMVAAAVEGLQGKELSKDSVLVSVKHFPGAGPQEGGWDGSPLVFDTESLQQHLIPFVAAIEAGAGSIMPYGYSEVPFLGDDAADRPAHESHKVMTGLLGEELGYDGLIQTDWGLRHLDSALAGADILGGAGLREIKRLAEGLSPEEIDYKVGRILEVKFAMGLFENPYVDPELAVSIVGNDEHRALAYEAARKSLTLIKHEFQGPLESAGNLLVAGDLADNSDALNSGWKVVGAPGLSILEALAERAGKDRVINIGNDAVLAAVHGGQGDAAIVVIGEEASTHQPPWGAETLEIPEDQLALLRTFNDADIPVITIVVLSRPYVLTELVELSDSVLVVYRPGVTEGARAIVDALYGDGPITGKLPVQIPRTMEQVVSQREDLPFDIDDPLYDVGYGIQTSSFCGI